MITLSLQQLQRRLQNELPAFHWQCDPVDHAPTIDGTELPQEIHVSASRSGFGPTKSFYISGNMLVRWGMDSSARIICNELTPKLQRSISAHASDWDDDKLAEY